MFDGGEVVAGVVAFVVLGIGLLLMLSVASFFERVARRQDKED